LNWGYAVIKSQALTAFLLIFLIAFPLASSSIAQITEGALAGTVTDPSGAVLPNTPVTVTNMKTGATREAMTDSVGFYRVTYLPPGLYQVKASVKGFKTAVVSDIQVSVNNTTRADLKLELGQLSEVVQVTGEAQLVNTEEGRLANTLDSRQVQELPLSGREIYALVLLQPGVTATLAPMTSNTQFNRFNYGFSANGNSPRGNNYVLDGVSNNNEWLGGTPAISPSVEAIAEFQVQTSNFSPEYGRNNGSVVTVVSRSGTNEFHGSLYEFHRNSAADAQNYFASALTPSRLLQNQFGGSLGGRIIRDKTFFFVNYEGIRSRDGQVIRGVGETPEFRNEVATYRQGSIADIQFKAFPAPRCLPGTSVDAGSIYAKTSPLDVVKKTPYIEWFAGAKDGIPDTCTTSYTDNRAIRGDQYTIKVDHKFRQKDTLFFRWMGDNRKTDSGREQLGGAVTRGFKAPFIGNFPSFVAGYTHLLSSRSLNDFRFAWARSDFGIGFSAPGAKDTANYPVLLFDSGVTRFGGAIFVPRNFIFNNFTINDSFAFGIGRHNLKAGFEMRRILENSNYKLETVGFYEFQDMFTFANDSPYYAEGLVNPKTGQFTDTPRNFRWTQWGLFVQDDFKASRNLTLNLGLRYDLFGGPSEKDGLLSNIKLGSGSGINQIRTATIGRVSSMFQEDHNNFAPRFGFAWDPRGNGRTAIRGSFSIAYLEPYSNLYTNASRFDPPDSAFPFVFPYYYGGTINYGVPAIPSTGFQTGLTPSGGIPGTRISVSGVANDIRTAYTQQWFLGVQHRIAGPFGVSLNYVGTAGRKLYIRDDINRFTGDRVGPGGTLVAAKRFNSEWAGTTYVKNGTTSSYNGFNLQLQKSYSRHNTFSINYTFGKALDIVSDAGLADYTNIGVALYTGAMESGNARLDRGPSAFDIRQRLTAFGLWDLPSPRGPKGLREILGGWQWNAILTLQSGRPFTVLCANTNTCDYNADGLGYDRPNAPTWGNNKSGLSKQDFLNGIFTIADFPTPVLGKNGTLGRNTFRGPGYATLDTSLFKTVKLHDRLSMQFRFEGFNLFNRTNLLSPNATLSGAASFFGKSTVAFNPRQMQFALKLIF
jgi:hypothetical protein